MNHTVTAGAEIPRELRGEQNESDIIDSFRHGLEREFGADAWDVKVELEEIGPTSRSGAFVGVWCTFESSLDARALHARLNEFYAGGKNDDIEWDLSLDNFTID